MTLLLSWNEVIVSWLDVNVAAFSDSACGLGSTDPSQNRPGAASCRARKGAAVLNEKWCVEIKRDRKSVV